MITLYVADSHALNTFTEVLLGGARPNAAQSYLPKDAPCSPTHYKSMTATITGLRLGPYGYAPAPKMLISPPPSPKTLRSASKITQKPQIIIGQKLSAKRLTEHDAHTYLTLDTQTTRNIIVSTTWCAAVHHLLTGLPAPGRCACCIRAQL